MLTTLGHELLICFRNGHDLLAYDHHTTNW